MKEETKNRLDKSEEDIEKIILFGSQATGKTREGSDIDHIVQKKDEPVDFICYTPEEFNVLSKKITIVKQAVKEGVEI